MNYGEVKAQFRAVLNRRDVTPTLLETFIKQAIQRAQRLLRVPASEMEEEFTAESLAEGVMIPGGYLKLVSLSVDGHELTRANLGVVRAASRTSGVPKFFARHGYRFIIGPIPQGGGVVNLMYSADLTALVQDDDENWLTYVAPDIIVNGAMSYACNHFTDPRKQQFEDDFVKAIVDLNNQAFEDELTNAQVTGAYSLDFDW